MKEIRSKNIPESLGNPGPDSHSLTSGFTAVLFDIDGTLLDMRGVGKQSFARALKSGLGIDDDLSRISFSGCTDSDLLRQIMEYHGRQITPEDYRKFERQLPIELEAASHRAELTLYPGVRELLETLSATPGIILGLVTGNIELCAWIKLRQFNLHHHFVLGAFGNEHANRNELARLAMKRVEARLNPSQTIKAKFLIGDTPNDISAAHTIGAVSIAVATGKHTVAELHEAGAMVALPDLADTTCVLEILRK